MNKGDVVKTVWSGDEVEFVCRRCNKMIKIAYRRSEVDSQSSKTNNAMIDKSITAQRYVAWVGYATDKDTLMFSSDEIDARIVKLVSRVFSHWMKPTNPDNSFEEAVSKALCDISSLKSQQDSDWLIRSLRKQALWEMRYESFSGSRRSIWFCDFDTTEYGRPFEGKVIDKVACWTGNYSCGHYNNYYEDYDPPYLWNAKHHCLYLVRSKQCEFISMSDIYMIHPDDVRLI